MELRKLRGNSEAVVQYTWGKIYNAKAYNACSNMPRMGHYKLLTEDQMRHVMALLLDPASPVNQWFVSNRAAKLSSLAAFLFFNKVFYVNES